MLREIHHSVLGLPSQRRFYDSTARFKGFSGPVGSGKTYALCHEALRAACRNPECTGLIGAPTYRHLKDVTIPIMVTILEELNIPFQSREGAQPSMHLERQRAQIIFRSLEKPNRLRGLNLAWFGIDELTYCRAEAWQVLCQTHPGSESQASGGLRGLDTQGFRLGIPAFHLAQTEAARLSGDHRRTDGKR